MSQTTTYKCDRCQAESLDGNFVERLGVYAGKQHTSLLAKAEWCESCLNEMRLVWPVKPDPTGTCAPTLEDYIRKISCVEIEQTWPPCGYRAGSLNTELRGRMMLMSDATQKRRRYGDYWITYNPKPIPARWGDWDWVHVDYDGAPDSGDRRCGSASSEIACVLAINELEADLEETPR